ncbi:hypothetical protein COV19_03550 [Candidatus Woesearchaeota archaeon CG10_big_fil_rev_8_21_14_0_10_44_13]|nr:MAG: hypothetical protein COV19_03550 [Candidatus Woesearchaeota archaeon CG10_big_fil_rev_8_21_14_0_10_44_13]
MIYHGLSFDIDAIDIVLEKKIKDKLSVLMEKNRKGFTPKDFNNALGVILTPNYTSYMTEFDIELYGVCSFIKKNGAEDSFETKKEVREKIKALLSRFWWIELTWSQRNRKTFEGVVSEIKEIIKKGEDIDREAIRLKNSAEEAETRKKILGKDLKFDDEMDTYIDIFENYAVFHDYRKEAQMKTTEALNIILGEIGKRKGHDPGDLAWCWPDEIKKVFEGEGIDKNKADERRKSFFMLVEKKGIEQHTGKKAAERRGEELLSAFEGITNFTGTIASPGKEIGKAKVCFSSQDAIKKIGKGDILVASMTLPDYVPAMKKAAAIVTDEGGVTCHAAIVSRELKIPCIIGTGIATKVLKDGDYIEVNANHGVVRILEKAKSGGQE